MSSDKNQLALFDSVPEPEPIFTAAEWNEINSWRAQRLIESGEMPSLEQVEAAVNRARENYRRKVQELRDHS